MVVVPCRGWRKEPGDVQNKSYLFWKAFGNQRQQTLPGRPRSQCKLAFFHRKFVNNCTSIDGRSRFVFVRAHFDRVKAKEWYSFVVGLCLIRFINLIQVDPRPVTDHGQNVFFVRFQERSSTTTVCQIQIENRRRNHRGHTWRSGDSS